MHLYGCIYHDIVTVIAPIGRETVSRDALFADQLDYGAAAAHISLLPQCPCVWCLRRELDNEQSIVTHAQYAPSPLGAAAAFPGHQEMWSANESVAYYVCALEVFVLLVLRAH